MYIPAFLTEKDEKIISAVIEPFDGLYCESASGLFLAKRYKKKFFGGIELNVANNFTYEALQLDGASEIALSKELSKSEIDKMPGGSVLALGNIKVMSLIYCPFGKTCADCNRHSYFTLKDGAGREFPVRRYRISECRFEIYNEKMLRSKTDFSKQIFDFTGVSANKVNEIIKLYLENKNSPEYTFTSGNLQKGVE